VDKLGLNRSNWVETVRSFGRLVKQAVGRSSSLVDTAALIPGQGSGSIRLCIGHWLGAAGKNGHLHYAFIPMSVDASLAQLAGRWRLHRPNSLTFHLK
jgi:hypothetical protein